MPKETYKHEYGGNGVCRRCSHDSFSTPSECLVPPGMTIYDNPDEPHAYGEVHPIGTQLPAKKENEQELKGES